MKYFKLKVLVFAILSILVDGCSHRPNSDNLIRHLNKNGEKMRNLEGLLRSILPDGVGLSFGFDPDETNFYMIVQSLDADNEISHFSRENLSIESKSIDKILERIDWSIGDLKNLITLLNDCNCIGFYKQAYTNSPIEIIYSDSGTTQIGSSSYLFFESKLSDSLKRYWGNREGHKIINDSTIIKQVYPL